jgi:hypothetical protein
MGSGEAHPLGAGRGAPFPRAGFMERGGAEARRWRHRGRRLSRNGEMRHSLGGLAGAEQRLAVHAVMRSAP